MKFFFLGILWGFASQMLIRDIESKSTKLILHVVSILLCLAFAMSLTGCATNDVIYRRDCRMEPVLKRCIEIPMGPQRDRR